MSLRDGHPRGRVVLDRAPFEVRVIKRDRVETFRYEDGYRDDPHGLVRWKLENADEQYVEGCDARLIFDAIVDGEEDAVVFKEIRGEDGRLYWVRTPDVARLA